MRFYSLRFVGGILSIALLTLLVPVGASSASKEQMEMQRDIAQLQDQVRTLQSGFDQKMAALQTLVQAALDAGNKANTTVSVLNSSVTTTLEHELRDRLTPVAGLSAKVDNVSNDAAELRNAVADLTAQINKMQQQLNDISNGIKVLQAPPAPPPGSDTAIPGAGPGGAAGAPPASVLFQNANRDYLAGKLDLAIGEFTDFLRFYPDDPNAPGAQVNIAQSHMLQGKYEQAAKDFDTVLERFPDSGATTRDAWFQKGIALKDAGHRDDAIKVWRELARKFPASDQAKQANEQLRALGVSPATTVKRRP